MLIEKVLRMKDGTYDTYLYINYKLKIKFIPHTYY